MKRLILVLLTWCVFTPLAFVGEAQAGDDVDQAIEDARRQLDEAATVLGELYREQFAGGDHSKRAMLGILLGDEASKNGVELFGVTPKGGAEGAGMQAGDLIIKLDELELGESDNAMRALSAYMKNIEPGGVVSVVYLRDGKREDATITTQARDTHMLSMLEKKMEKLGRDMEIELEGIMDIPHIKREILVHKSKSDQFLAVDGDLAEYFDVDAGVVIIKPPKDSEFKAGDVLLKVADNPVEDVNNAQKLLSNIETDAQVIVQRKGKRKTLDVVKGEFADLTSINKTRIIRVKKPGEGEEEVVVKVEVVD